MEVLRTADRYKKKVLARFTAKVSAGHLYEVAALGYCRAKGYRVVRRNYFVGKAELDLLVQTRSGDWILIEVRGREQDRYLPRHMISRGKIRRLRWLADHLAKQVRQSIQIELLEVIGVLPNTKLGRWFWWGTLRLCPQLLGIRFTNVKI